MTTTTVMALSEQDGQDGHQFDHVEEEGRAGGEVGPDDEADHGRAGERGDF
jgi:hypothetical protein